MMSGQTNKAGPQQLRQSKMDNAAFVSDHVCVQLHFHTGQHVQPAQLGGSRARMADVPEQHIACRAPSPGQTRGRD